MIDKQIEKSEEGLEARYGLPKKVIFCKRCVMSNQRPGSSVEFKHKPGHKHVTLQLDDEGICNACRFVEAKEKVDWKKREEELIKLLDKYRRNDGNYDCVVPGSGGKDSAYAAHVLKYKYGMHPLTVTWPPLLYTDIGWKNFRNWLDVGGFDNISFNYNGKVHTLLTKLSLQNLLHPFLPFILGQKNLAPKIAVQMGIPLVFFGENEAEHGHPVAEDQDSLRNKIYYTMKNLDDIYLAGVPIPELKKKYGLTLNDLSSYLPVNLGDIENAKVEVQYLGYYLKWIPQEVYYYSVEHTGFQPNQVRTEGTYSKYNSIDDKVDGFHFYTTFIKFGIGRTTYDSSQEIRNKHLTREEGQALVARYDGEFPQRYFKDVMTHLGIKEEEFFELCDKFRSPHLWKKTAGGEWKLRHTVNRTGVDD